MKSVLDSPHLNDAQRRAVSLVEGPLLVIAGAGSGKTMTLSHRAAYLVERGIPPEGILLLTFTRKASEEMLRRSAALLDGRCERISGGTFHSFAHLALRRHGAAAGLPPDFTILDRSDSEEIVSILRAEMGFAGKESRFPRAGAIAEWGSKTVNCAMSLEDVVTREAPQFSGEVGDLTRLLAGYSRYKQEHALLDYDDLLVTLCRLMEASSESRDALSRRSGFILVDEYQDTNLLQARILRLLASVHDNVMVVGDDCQSIYSFRGARVANILQFPQEYKGTRLVKLEENYRSRQPILDLANHVVKAMERKYDKRLTGVRGQGEHPTVLRALSDKDLARHLAGRILEMREEGRSLSEIAVLFRSSFHAFDLELELSRANIPFVKWGGIKLMETAHLKDCLAFLRVAVNPKDRLSWIRLLRLAPGVGEKTAGKIAGELAASADPAAALEKGEGPAKAKETLKAFARLVASIGGEEKSPARAVSRVVDAYTPILKERYLEDYPSRLKDLEQFAAIAGRYKSIRQLLADLALEPVTDSVKEASREDREEPPLVLSTIHSAKGLEWPVVFVLGLVEGRFPPGYAADDPESMDEERRLFYVAVTRAKDELHLCYPAYHYERAFGSVMSAPSRFLEEIPGRLYRRVEIGRAAFQEGGADYPDYAE